jgi:hypothetical protein
MSGVSIAAGEIPSAGKLSITNGEGVASGNLAMTSTVTDVPGATITLTSQTSSSFYVATITARMDRSTTASTSIGIVRLDVDGSSVAGVLPIQHNVTVAEIFTISKTWTGPLAAGSHTFKVRGSSSTSSIWTVTSGDTNIVVTVYG